MTTPDDPFHPGGTFGPYQIVDRIGDGGMAAVWRAVHLGLHKPVAIKALRPDQADSPQARERFLREGRVISRIRHAHVVEVHDLGLVGDIPYLVMELLEGEDLRTLFLRRGALPVDELSDLLVPVCAAVASAHEASVVHRDLKPANIFLERTRDRGIVPKVLDFGISRLDDGPRANTAASVVLGTPRYMAPEQVRGARFTDARSDQYALGVLLYQGATGRVPIDDPSLYDLLKRIVQGDLAPPRHFRPDLPPAFEAVVLRALALRPDDRFGSVRELGAALIPFASERTRILHAPAFGVDDTTSPSLSSAQRIGLGPLNPTIAVVAAPPPPVRAPTPDPHSLTLGAALEVPAVPRPSSMSSAKTLTGVFIGITVLAFAMSLLLKGPTSRPDAPPTVTVAPAAPPAPAPPPPPLALPAPGAAVLPVAPPDAPVAPVPTVTTVLAEPAVVVAPELPPRPVARVQRPARVQTPRVQRPAHRPTTATGVNAHDID